MTEEAFELAYQNGLRALDVQATMIDSIVTRAGQLASSTIVATAFFGGLALTDRDPTCLAWAAFAAFGCALACCFAVIAPRPQRWLLVLDPAELTKRIENQPGFELHQWYSALASEIGRSVDENERRAKVLVWLCFGAMMFLFVEIFFWVLQFGGS